MASGDFKNISNSDGQNEDEHLIKSKKSDFEQESQIISQKDKGANNNDAIEAEEINVGMKNTETELNDPAKNKPNESEKDGNHNQESEEAILVDLNDKLDKNEIPFDQKDNDFRKEVDKADGPNFNEAANRLAKGLAGLESRDAAQIEADYDQFIKPGVGIFNYRWTHIMDQNEVPTRKLQMDAIGDVFYENYHEDSDDEDHDGPILENNKDKKFNEMINNRASSKKIVAAAKKIMDKNKRKKNISDRSCTVSFHKRFLSSSKCKKTVREKLTSRKYYKELQLNLALELENAWKKNPEEETNKNKNAIKILKEKMKPQIYESKLMHKKMPSRKVKNLYNIWGTVINSDGRDKRIRFATNNALWNYEYEVEYTTRKRYTAEESQDDTSKSGLGISTAKKGKRFIEENIKKISGLKTQGQSIIGNFKICSFTEKNFYILNDQGIIQMWSNDGGPLVDVQSTLPQEAYEINDQKFPFELLEVVSFVAINDNLIFYCDRKNIYKVFLPTNNEYLWQEKIKKTANEYDETNHEVYGEIHDNEPEDPEKQAELEKQKLDAKVLLENAVIWKKELVCSYERISTLIDGFDICNDNMIIYNDHKDLDIFRNISKLETGNWRSEPFFEDNFEGIVFWKFFCEKLIIVTQQNTVQIYNFEQRKLLQKIENPQDRGQDDLPLNETNINDNIQPDNSQMQENKEGVTIDDPTYVGKSTFPRKDSPDGIQSADVDIKKDSQLESHPGDEEVDEYDQVDCSKYFLHSKFNKQYREDENAKIPQESICHLLYIESDKLGVKRKILVLGYANGDIIFVNQINNMKHRIKTDSIIECIHFDEELMTIFVLNNTSNLHIVDIVNNVWFDKNLFKLNGMVLSTCCSANNKYMYMAGQNGILKQISLEELAQSNDYGSVHKGTINAMITTSDNKYLFTGDSKGEIKRFAIGPKLYMSEAVTVTRENEEDGSINPLAHDYEIKCLAVTEDSEYQFSIDKEGELRQWNIYDMSLENDYGDISEGVTYSLCCSPNNKFQFTSDDLGYIKQFEILANDIVRTITNTHEGEVYAICISRDTQYIFSTDSKGTLKQWNVEFGALVKDYGKVHNGAIQVCICSRDNNYLFTTDDQGMVKQYSIMNREIIRKLDTPNSKSIKTACITYDSKVFITCDIFGDLNAFKIKIASLVQTCGSLHSSKINCFATSRDNRYIISGDENGGLLEWDWKAGDYGFTSIDPFGHGNLEAIDYLKEITAIEISNDNSYMFVGNMQGMIFVFEALKFDWELVSVKKCHDKEIVKILFPKNKTEEDNSEPEVLTCSGDCIRLWKLSNDYKDFEQIGSEWTTLGGAQFKCIVLSQDQNYFAAGQDKGDLMLGSLQNCRTNTMLNQKKNINYEMLDSDMTVHNRKWINSILITNNSMNLFVSNIDGKLFQWSWKHILQRLEDIKQNSKPIKNKDEEEQEKKDCNQTSQKKKKEIKKLKDKTEGETKMRERKSKEAFNWKGICLLRNYGNVHGDAQIKSLAATPDSKFLFSTAFSPDSLENGFIFIWYIDQQKLLYKISNEVTQSKLIYYMNVSTKVYPRLDNTNFSDKNVKNEPVKKRTKRSSLKAIQDQIEYKEIQKTFLNKKKVNIDIKDDQSQNKTWNKTDMFSNYKNKLYLHFIDNTNEVKFICLDNFFSDNDFWEIGSNYVVPCAIKYYNIEKQMNFMSSVLLNSLDGADGALKDFISRHNTEITELYKEVKIISATDILVMFLVYMTLDFKMYIPKFMQALVENPHALRSQLAEIIGPILCCLDDSIGQKVIISIFEYSFISIEHMKRATRDLVDKEVVSSHTTVHIDNSEMLDNESFYLPAGDTPPIDVNMFKFNYSIDVMRPEPLFLEFLRSSYKYLASDMTALKNPKLDMLINYLWNRAKTPMLYNLYFSIIPYWILVAQAYVLRHEQTELLKLLSYIRVSFMPFLIFHEIVKCLAFGPSLYFSSVLTYVDIVAIFLHILSAEFLYSTPKETTINTSVYAYTLLIVTQKLNFDLDVIDYMRKLTSSIRKVIIDMKSFLVIFFFALFSFAQMFYFTKFFTSEDNQEFHWYVLYTFNSFFANWDYSTPENDKLVWTQLIFFVFSFQFPIIMFNILISMVSTSYADSEQNMLNDDNKRILHLTRQCIELKKLYAAAYNKICCNRKKIDEADHDMSYIYVCIEKKDTESIDESEWENYIMSKVKRIPVIESAINKIAPLNSKVFKLSQRVDTAQKMMNATMKKANQEIENAQREIRDAKASILREKLAIKKAEQDAIKAEEEAQKAKKIKNFDIKEYTSGLQINGDECNMTFLNFMKYSNMFIKHCNPDADDETLKTLEDSMQKFSEEVQMKIQTREDQIAQLKQNVKPTKKVQGKVQGKRR